MLRQTGLKTCVFVLAFAGLALAKAKPPSATPSPWASYGKTATAPRVPMGSLAGRFAAPGMDTITVPYMPKSSPFFPPKFVDPKAMVSKKVDMLGNMFSGFGPVDWSVGAPAPFSPFLIPRPNPILYATTTSDDDYQDFNTDPKMMNKRGAFGPGGPKFGAPKMSPFSPFAQSPMGVFPFAPQYGPYGPGAAAYSYPSGFYGGGQIAPPRVRRSVGPPPAYPGLAPIAEEPTETDEAKKLAKLFDPIAARPMESSPGLFGPFGPFSPYPVPMVDPAIMAANKKKVFLDALFQSLATASPTAAAVDADAEITELPVTELPVPKSTIVPPDFWLPSAIVPGPGEYTAKVATFLDKLFTHIANKTAAASAAAAAAATDETAKNLIARSLTADEPSAKVNTQYSRSIEDIKTIAAAKDAIVDSILAELGDLKTDMIGTLNDYIKYVKTAPIANPGSKKPFKKPSPFAAFFAPPTADPTLPFAQRMAALSDVFDMLTGLERNITLAVQKVIESATDSPKIVSDDDAILENKYAEVKDDYANEPQAVDYSGTGSYNAYGFPVMNIPVSMYNATLMNAIKARLAKLDKATGGADFAMKPMGAGYQAAPVKRDIEDHDDAAQESQNRRGEDDGDLFKRAVQMRMHQGYQNMPPGAMESVQAGGNSVPGHQGGGIKLLNSQYNADQDWTEWAEQFESQNENRDRHHHNRH